MPTLDELEWRELPQGDRAQWAKNEHEYIEVWRWHRSKWYSIAFHQNGMFSFKHNKTTWEQANSIVCDYTGADTLMAYCYKLVESGEAEPLPYGLDKLFKKKATR